MKWHELSGISGKRWKEKAWIIRLAYQGCRNRPFFHIQAVPKSRPRDWDCEQIGSFDPIKNESGEKLVAINMDRLKFWMSNGAELSNPVAKLLGISGVFPVNPNTYIRARKNRELIQQGELSTWSYDKETWTDDNNPLWRNAKKKSEN